MKKIYVFLYCSFCYFTILFAQNDMPFAPVGAKWTSGGIYTIPPWGTPTVEMDVCTKDTIIEGKKCSEIQLDKRYYICYLLAYDKLYMYKENGKLR